MEARQNAGASARCAANYALTGTDVRMHAALIRLWYWAHVLPHQNIRPKHIAMCLQGMRLLSLQHSPAQLRSRRRGVMTCRGGCWPHVPHVCLLHTLLPHDCHKALVR